MKNTLLEDPILFFREIGDMHDAIIDAIVFNISEKQLTMSVNDVNSGFCGLPEYLGKRKASLIFSEVARIELLCDISASDIQRIYDFDLFRETVSEAYSVMMKMSPGGHLSFKCASIEIRYPSKN